MTNVSRGAHRTVASERVSAWACVRVCMCKVCACGVVCVPIRKNEPLFRMELYARRVVEVLLPRSKLHAWQCLHAKAVCISYMPGDTPLTRVPIYKVESELVESCSLACACILWHARRACTT
eukprot:scaffold86079_cov69-Phaeocystis_antarctica.AAC.1